jgi:hypothetical protein
MAQLAKHSPKSPAQADEEELEFSCEHARQLVAPSRARAFSFPFSAWVRDGRLQSHERARLTQSPRPRGVTGKEIGDFASVKVVQDPLPFHEDRPDALAITSDPPPEAPAGLPQQPGISPKPPGQGAIVVSVAPINFPV